MKLCEQKCSGYSVSVVKYISCLLFSWFAQTTKIFLQRKFPDLRYVAYVPIQISEMIGILLSVYVVVYVMYRLMVWMKTLQLLKKKYNDQLIPDTEEPDRLTHPEDYENDKEVKLLLSDDRENDYPQDSKLETYPMCGKSQQKYGSV